MPLDLNSKWRNELKERKEEVKRERVGEWKVREKVYESQRESGERVEEKEERWKRFKERKIKGERKGGEKKLKMNEWFRRKEESVKKGEKREKVVRKKQCVRERERWQ